MDILSNSSRLPVVGEEVDGNVAAVRIHLPRYYNSRKIIIPA